MNSSGHVWIVHVDENMRCTDEYEAWCKLCGKTTSDAAKEGMHCKVGGSGRKG